MKKALIYATLILLFACLSVFAKPAPWYKWESKLTGKVICKQVSPGDGWNEVGGPYKDSRCKVEGEP